MYTILPYILRRMLDNRNFYGFTLVKQHLRRYVMAKTTKKSATVKIVICLLITVIGLLCRFVFFAAIVSAKQIFH